MTDRELLEYAAKAAGIEGSQCDWKTALKVTRDRGVSPVLWNPLTDDGDALRLAVKLHIITGAFSDYSNACGTGQDSKVDVTVWAHEEADTYTATRRAIVRAAAEIGKAMP